MRSTWTKRVIVMVLIFAFSLYNTCNIYAAQKKQEIRKTFRLLEVGDGGAPCYVIVNVVSIATEKYSYDAKKVKFTNREVYAYFDEVTALSGYTCGVSPTCYYNKNDTLIRKFSWSNSDAIYPGNPCYTYCKKNNSNVSFNRSNTNKAKWTVAVSAPDTFDKVKVQTGVINLYLSSK